MASKKSFLHLHPIQGLRIVCIFRKRLEVQILLAKTLSKDIFTYTKHFYLIETSFLFLVFIAKLIDDLRAKLGSSN